MQEHIVEELVTIFKNKSFQTIYWQQHTFSKTNVSNYGSEHNFLPYENFWLYSNWLNIQIAANTLIQQSQCHSEYCNAQAMANFQQIKKDNEG